MERIDELDSICESILGNKNTSKSHMSSIDDEEPVDDEADANSVSGASIDNKKQSDTQLDEKTRAIKVFDRYGVNVNFCTTSMMYSLKKAGLSVSYDRREYPRAYCYSDEVNYENASVYWIFVVNEIKFEATLTIHNQHDSIRRMNPPDRVLYFKFNPDIGSVNHSAYKKLNFEVNLYRYPLKERDNVISMISYQYGNYIKDFFDKNEYEFDSFWTKDRRSELITMFAKDFNRYKMMEYEFNDLYDYILQVRGNRKLADKFKNEYFDTIKKIDADIKKFGVFDNLEGYY